MAELWYYLVASMLAVYVVLDGFDLGVGILHVFITRDASERRTLIHSIGPLWDGNEVWLVAAGGTLVAAFPALYATAFSGFYLPLMITLWLLVLRGLSIELQHQYGDPMWLRFWDGIFSFSSLLLALVLGVALGNLVRGVPLGEDGFFVPLWTDLSPRGEVGVIDLYTLLVGATAVLVLALHGASWICMEEQGDLQQRALRLLRRLRWAVAAALLMTTAASFWVQPGVLETLRSAPWTYSVGLWIAFAWWAIGAFASRRPSLAFASSCLLIVSLLAAAIVAAHPFVLPAMNRSRSLLASDAAAPTERLRTMLYWWIPGMLLACSYTLTMLRIRHRFRA